MGYRNYPKSIYLDRQFGALGQASCFNNPHLDKTGRFVKLFNAFSYSSSSIEWINNQWVIKFKSNEWKFDKFEPVETIKQKTNLFD